MQLRIEPEGARQRPADLGDARVQLAGTQAVARQSGSRIAAGEPAASPSLQSWMHSGAFDGGTRLAGQASGARGGVVGRLVR